MASREIKETRCLVTGASSGLGRAISELLARRGARVILTGRSQSRLDEIVSRLLAEGVDPESLVAISADLTVSEERTRLMAEVAARYSGALDLLVNSAGVGAYGRFESHDPMVLRRIFEINFFALAEVTRASLPLLRRGNRPSLINVGSIIARRSLPGRSEYSATKHAVAALTDSLRAELRIDGIHVLLINPGFTATPFEEHLLVDTAIYRTSHRRTMTPNAVAQATIRAWQARRSEVTLTLPGRLLLFVNRMAPRFVDWGLGRWTSRLYANRDDLILAESRSTTSRWIDPLSVNEHS